MKKKIAFYVNSKLSNYRVDRTVIESDDKANSEEHSGEYRFFSLGRGKGTYDRITSVRARAPITIYTVSKLITEKRDGYVLDESST